MVRRDFYRAASRHLSACSFLLSILKNINSKDERKTILLEVYYLSGYVIETLISYAIFKFVGCKENDKIEEHRIYTPAFKKHRFSEKLAFAANHKLRFKGIVLIDSRRFQHANAPPAKLKNIFVKTLKRGTKI